MKNKCVWKDRGAERSAGAKPSQSRLPPQRRRRRWQRLLARRAALAGLIFLAAVSLAMILSILAGTRTDCEDNVESAGLPKSDVLYFELVEACKALMA